MIKRLAVTATILVAIGLTTIPALAQSSSPAASTKGEKATQRLSNLKNRADKEVDRRVASLNNLVGKVNSIKRLTDSQKSTFVSQIQTEVTNLTTLKAKIDADTDLDTLKADIKSIVNSYRVYALFIPKIHLLVAADGMLETADKFTALVTKLQTKIQAAQGAGKDVSSLQATLTDLQSKITDAKNQANQVISTVTPLAPEGYPGNKTTLQTASNMLKTGRADFKAARDDAKTIVSGLKALGVKQPGASSSPKP